MTNAPDPTPPVGFFARFAACLGGLVAVSVYPIYMLSTTLWAQQGTVRAIGNLALLLLPFTALALVGAAVGYAVRDRAILMLGARLAFYWAFCLSVLSVGGIVFRWTGVKALAAFGLVALAACANLARSSPAVQVAITGGVTRFGLALAAVPVLASPLWGTEMLTERIEVFGGATPPAPTAPIPNAPKHIMLVSFDAWRARSTSLVRPEITYTPHLQALAGEATYFPDFRASSDRTLVAMPAIYAGLRPSVYFPYLGNRAGHMRPGTMIGLARYLQAAGYKTAMITTSHRWRNMIFALFATDFDHAELLGPTWPPSLNVGTYLAYKELWRWRPGNLIRRSVLGGDDIENYQACLDHAADWRARGGDRTFTWVHIGAPHYPFIHVPKELLGKRLDHSGLKPVDRPRGQDHDLGEFEVAYEDFVAFADAELGRLVARLKQEGRWDDTLVVVTSDHGESFADGIASWHARGFAQEDVTHVPLLIHEPGQAHGAVVRGRCGHEDLAPTILGEVLPAPPGHLKGLSLLRTRPLPDRTVFTWAAYDAYLREDLVLNTSTIAAYKGRHKLLYNVERQKAALYDLEADPREKADLVAKEPKLVEELTRAVLTDCPP